MQAGRLNRRVGLHHVSTTGLDDAGEPIETAEHYADRWAEIVTLAAAERQLAASLEGQTTYRITVRSTPEAVMADRVQCGASWWEVLSVFHDDRESLTIITAKAADGV